VSFRKSREV